MQRTPFYQFHVEHGAKFVDFAGWEMPIMYRSIHEEHHQVRNSGGLFDVSHMGRIRISGRHARKLLETLLTRYISDMDEKQCRYSLICNESGGVIDDVLVYRFRDDWLLVVNASNRAKVIEHINKLIAYHEFVVKIKDETESTAMVAVQGPKVMDMVGKFSREIPTLGRYRFTTKNLLVLKMTISRTGYTGEDGIEVLLPAGMSSMAIKLLIKDRPEKDAEGGSGAVLSPVGLGARDTLRTEAGMPLYGHELDEETDPLTAGLDFAVSLDKDELDRGQPFVGQAAIKEIAAKGLAKKRVGLKLEGRRTARQGMTVRAGDAEVGAVTSACLSPTLEMPIAMAYVGVDHAEPGTSLTVQLGEQRVAAEVATLPFYKPA